MGAVAISTKKVQLSFNCRIILLLGYGLSIEEMGGAAAETARMRCVDSVWFLICAELEAGVWNYSSICLRNTRPIMIAMCWSAT